MWPSTHRPAGRGPVATSGAHLPGHEEGAGRGVALTRGRSTPIREVMGGEALACKGSKCDAPSPCSVGCVILVYWQYSVCLVGHGVFVDGNARRGCDG